MEGLKQGKTLTEGEIKEGFDCFDTSDFKRAIKHSSKKESHHFLEIRKSDVLQHRHILKLTYPIFTAKDKRLE